MAGNENAIDWRLDDIFNEGFELFHHINSGELAFNSTEFQNDVKKNIQLFEDCTRLVSSIGMFSSNENIDEIPTEHLRYLLLPYFLGQLNTKCLSHDREEAIKVADVYYKDFIKRCEEYGICTTQKGNSTPVSTDPNNLFQMAQQRNTKIEQYRLKKELEEQVENLKIAMKNEHVDDEIKRNFYLKLINLSIINAREEIPSIEQELQILKFRKERVDDMNGPQEKFKRQPPQREPLKPIIITRDAVQKAVFGMGYPSLPVMSVDEFYEERVRDGVFPDAEKVAEMNKQMLHRQTSEEKEEQEKAEKDALVDNDDPEYLARQRAFDEYKDQVRRGDGNRYNRS